MHGGEESDRRHSGGTDLDDMRGMYDTTACAMLPIRLTVVAPISKPPEEPDGSAVVPSGDLGLCRVGVVFITAALPESRRVQKSGRRP